MLSIEISALSYVSDAQIYKVWVTYGQNLARKRLTDVSHFNMILERHGAVVCNRNRVDILRRLSIMHERDRQTDRQRDRQTLNRQSDNSTDDNACVLLKCVM